MNLLSKCLQAGIYPKTMRVSRDEAERIIASFESKWLGASRLGYPTEKGVAYCDVFYTAKFGKKKICTLIWRYM